MKSWASTSNFLISISQTICSKLNCLSINCLYVFEFWERRTSLCSNCMIKFCLFCVIAKVSSEQILRRISSSVSMKHSCSSVAREFIFDEKIIARKGLARSKTILQSRWCDLVFSSKKSLTNLLMSWIPRKGVSYRAIVILAAKNPLIRS